MTALGRRANDWMFMPAPAERLAVFRILVGVFATVYLCVRFGAFAAVADNPSSRFDSVGALWWLDTPLPDWLWLGLLVATVALGVAFSLGALFQVTGPLFALLLLVVTTYRSSWGQLLHFENLLVIHALIIGFTSSADTLSIASRSSERPENRSGYGWPIHLAALVTVLTYSLAGVAKLRYGGLDWMLGDSLRNHVAYSAVRLDLLGGTPSPLAGPLVERAWIFPPLAIVTVLLELGAPVALSGRRIRNAWVAGAWLLHAGIAAAMFVVFPYPLFLVAFAPLFDLERLAERFENVTRSRRPVAACTAVPAHPPRRP